jgi:hypothetical protein
MTSSSDDSLWLSVGDELGDEWVEDDTKGSLHWEAARNRLGRADSTMDEPLGVAPSLPQPRASDDSSLVEQ